MEAKISDGILYVLRSLPVSKWGIADIKGIHPLATDFPEAISLLLAYQPEFQSYNEDRFHNLLGLKREELDESVDVISTFLKCNGIKHLVIPQYGQDPDTLMGMFPHKLAAVRAGLGWIGKNSLLVTEEYGTRIRLATILLDCADLPFGEAVTVGRCGECRICVDACPFGCIHNVEWQVGVSRDKLFDSFTCSRKREESIKTIGRKHTCGLCLLACPMGK